MENPKELEYIKNKFYIILNNGNTILNQKCVQISNNTTK